MSDEFATQLLASLFGIFILSFAVQMRIMSVLRNRHSNIYYSIPRPFLFAEDNNENNSKAICNFYIFLFQRKYMPLQDTELNWLCRLLVLLTAAFSITFGTAIYAFVSTL